MAAARDDEAPLAVAVLGLMGEMGGRARSSLLARSPEGVALRLRVRTGRLASFADGLRKRCGGCEGIGGSGLSA